MAEGVTSTIDIRIDEDALRAQIQRAVQGEIREMALHLMSAAYSVDPTLYDEIEREREKALRRKWESEREATRYASGDD